MKQKIFTVLSGLVTVLALVAASSACWVMAYQPKEPKCLKK